MNSFVGRPAQFDGDIGVADMAEEASLRVADVL
jgi:hypothetical protein